ncbi:calcium/sodium antiporter [Jannaschia sp. W003]|uniref:calcium/sodium antiporter n=1 Tax=Jannaschia sp. W003 TaxID=2867012 RepID=UPI0021A68933|nr:calcium/sodium antiporter [Jannaschia sp. W003]UWQ20970.1 calcium/sodium antiporter [Jannaschia sp. W003]
MLLLSLAAGLALLVAGGDGLVRGAVSVAARLGVSPLAIGLVLVGFGTSVPELVTSLQATWLGAPGIAVGNVVGSNIANVLLILGIGALLVPIPAEAAALRRDGAWLMGATALCIAAVLWGTLGRAGGAVLVAALALYVGTTWRAARAAPAGAAVLLDGIAPARGPAPNLWLGLGLAAAGIVATILGARLLVDAAIALAERSGLSETVVGLTVVAVGTSLPELAATVAAAARRQTDMALGNVVGSNIFNVLGILGVTALVRPIAVPAQIAAVDVWVMGAAALALLLAIAWHGGLGRVAGGLFVGAWALYTAWLVAAA